AATGAPTITGTATQGQTLTADTSGIADPDGLGSFSYQWKRGTTSISGATSSTYTLVGDDVGQTITVTVSWNDGGGTSESLTSAATAQVAAGVTVSFKESAHEVEEGDAVTLTLQLSQSLTTAVTINVVLTGITAGTQGTDFDDSSRSVSIPSGTTEVTFDVTTVEDPYDEEDETFRATIVAANLPAGVNRGTPNHSTVTIQDDDAPIKIFWEEATWNIAENAGTAYLLMQATRTVVVQAGDELEVNYSLSGTATCGTDYTITGADCDGGGGVFTIPADTAAFTSVLFPITLIDDNVNDNGETIIVTLKAGTGYKLGTTVMSTVTTYDDTGSAAFSISGTPRIGETLTVVKDSDDPDGNGSGMFSYSWQFRATSSDAWNNTAAINRGCSAGATCTPTHSATYPTVGGQFRAVVSYADGNGLGTTIFTSATNSFLSARTEHTLSLALASGESSNLDEGGDPVELVISGTPPLGDYSLFVTLGLSGTATRADHMLEYEVNPGEWQSVSAVATPRFDMNSLPAKLRVTAVDDGAAEGSETIAVTLGETPDRYQFGYSCPITPEDPSLGCIDEHGVDQSVSPLNTYVVGASSSVSLTIRPSEGPPNAAPTVDNPIPDQSATAGEAFSYAFAATAFSDPEGGTLTYTATKGDGTALPPWLAFTPSLRIFSGTPGSGDAGTVSVKVTATDSGSLSVEDTFDITVSAPPPVTPVASFGSATSSA
ncbi:MAG: putative Ig domain-containing protein, partial [Acidimicrobiaceae bacterium]|nr:putative Ig domain-containing protein [Acidimicrobiaceae bacterium]